MRRKMKEIVKRFCMKCCDSSADNYAIYVEIVYSICIFLFPGFVQEKENGDDQELNTAKTIASVAVSSLSDHASFT